MLMLLASARALNAQTNQIVFIKLLSCSNTVLMVNAEYRCTTGMRVAFMNADGCQLFDVRSIDTNALNRIGISPAQLALKDEKLKEYYRQCAITLVAQQQAQLAADSAQAEKERQASLAAAAQAANASQNDPPSATPPQPMKNPKKPKGFNYGGLIPLEEIFAKRGVLLGAAVCGSFLVVPKKFPALMLVLIFVHFLYHLFVPEQNPGNFPA